MVRQTLAIALGAALTLGTAFARAQTPTAAPAAQEKPAPRPPQPEGLPNNIRIELSITDQSGPGAPLKRTISMLVADRHTGSVRNQAPQLQARTATLNVDATPNIVKDGIMRLQLGLEYAPPAGESSAGEPRSLNQRLTLLVESGKPLVISQASDPTSDRRISVELTATILK
ncbi:MAG: hypothetical protein ABW318_13000 [Vicinamibacterales bacterium]